MAGANLAGKTAVITGSNSGIGLGVAEVLGAAGCNLVINSFTDRAEDHALAADLAKRHGVKVAYLQADMSKGDQCRTFVTKAADLFGGVFLPFFQGVDRFFCGGNIPVDCDQKDILPQDST